MALVSRSSLRVVQERSCGSCDLCCTSHAVEAIDKPRMTPCVHLAHPGCGIYATRPADCRRVKCQWLLAKKNRDVWTGANRPDRIGVVPWAEPPTEALRREGITEPVLVMQEMRAGALATVKVRHIVEEIARRGGVVVTRDLGGKETVHVYRAR